MPLPRVPAILLAVICLSLAVAPAHAQIKAEDVNTAVSSLASGDREKVMAGRVSLINLLNVVRTNPPALDSFSQDIGTKLMPIASGNDPHAKLNVAIVVQRVADMSGAPALADICTKLVSDESPAVSAYGLRAASDVLPRLYASAKPTDANALEAAVVKSVADHKESEAVADEAYDAIVRALNDRDASKLLGPTVIAAATPRAVDATHKLLAARIAMFGSGSLAEPGAEQSAVGFLGRQATWNASSPAQRTQTVTMLLELMQGCASEMGALPASPASRLRLEALRNLIKSAAGSLSVISDLENQPALKASAQKVQEQGLATPVAAYREVIAQLAADFSKAMPNVHLPATMPTTKPATAPQP